MTYAGRTLMQAASYVPLMVLIGYFSSAPVFVHLPADQALLRLSIAHAAELRHACRERSPAELAKLPPNMRAAQDCPRERSPLLVELEIDGVVAYRTEALPAGAQRDGLATLYHRLPIAAGAHRIVVRMRDRPQGDFNHVREETLNLAGGDSVLIDFNASRGGLEFRR
ncbi:MAG: hypothetical protein WAO95_08870 [Burkholderiales bacterium]